MLSKFYRELEIQTNAPLSEIKKAYRKLAKKYHPDINKDPDAEHKFKMINEAYTILTDDKARSKYMAENGKHFGGFQGGGMFGGMSMDDLFRNFGGPGFSGFNRNDMSNQRVKLEVPLDVMLKGDLINININGSDIAIQIPEKCLNGFEIKKKTDNFDLVLVIVAAKRYSNDTIIVGNDIVKSVRVNVIDLIFGNNIKVDTPFGEVDVVIPESTKKDTRIMTPNKGVPHINGVGNLIVQFDINIPSKDEFIDLLNNSNTVDLKSLISDIEKDKTDENDI